MLNCNECGATLNDKGEPEIEKLRKELEALWEHIRRLEQQIRYKQDRMEG